MMKILIFGKDGQLGKAFYKLLLAPQTQVPHASVQFIGRADCDLANTQAIIELLNQAKPDLIINAAAYTAVDKAESEPELAMLVNGQGARNVAEAAAELGVPLLHLSTDYVFDGKLDRPYCEIGRAHV